MQDSRCVTLTFDLRYACDEVRRRAAYAALSALSRRTLEQEARYITWRVKEEGLEDVRSKII